ncbi:MULTISPECIES: alternative ribosome rescue aminoacyl-tRNA hydrolase ArfB [unclassified Sphingobacterium]|jgi:ribosome-associated protein|uniref:alternative ribosome rescue aminoacyl-tRNA hydrolase ArfB n=1 Tax=unclassified Sphingobacterium TaxID=2609468 RepID=UPI0025E4616B|nr:alternative ribosome rescue aminoacyl-tRNA hydrolase ArfB [Sphingobacterium sp. UBA5670]MDR0262950.1 aminoacyl-tRNA hydrolase [Sphingobacterium sp.]
MNLEGVVGELTFKFSRSGGAGGQHVNKVSSKVLLQWDVNLSTAVSVEEKAIIFTVLTSRINKEGILQLECDIDRSQLRNKEIAIDRFKRILEAALVPAKPRKKTKVPYSSILKRLDRKKQQSQLKASRKKNFDE